MADKSITFAILAKNLASGEFEKAASSADKLKKQLNEADKSLGGFAAKAAGAIGGLAAVGAVFRTGLTETKDYQAGLAQLQAGLKSTGDASGMTAQGMEKLATKIQGYSGQTDDSIVKSESLLLTFRNIHDQTGKNNDIFSQATKLTADMAARFGGEASDNAVKLGKALNDPVKGLGALSKMGVTFSESQKNTIKQMVKTGDTLGAQKLILGQVNAAVGGSAQAFGKTLPGQIEIAHRKFEDVSQTLVTKLTPAFSAALSWVSKGIDFFSKYQGVIVPVVAVIGGLALAIKAYTTTAKIATAVSETWAKVQMVLNGELALNPIGLVVIAIAALTIGLVEAWKHSETFRDIVKGALHVVSVAFDGVKTAAVTVFNWIKNNWPLLVGIITGPIGLGVYFIAKHFETFKKVAAAAIKAVVGFFLTMAGDILGLADKAFGWVPGLGGKLHKANDAFKKFKDGVMADLSSLEGDHVIHVNVRTAVGDAAQGAANTAKAERFASGGLIRGPGGPRDDRILAYLSNGEAVVPAHLVPHVAPILGAHGVPGFADGGLVVQTNAATAANGLGAQLRSIVDGALSRMASAFSFTGGGAGVQRWAGLVSQVLGMLGLSPILLGKVLSQMSTESGGNPGAINLTDSNALAGHPSQGLMQVIPGTFAAYAGPFAGLGILNPLANIYAGLNYAAHRYGPGLAGLGEGHGYDSGGWLKPGVSLTYNGTGKPEAILTHEQWQSVRRGGDTFIIQAWDGPSVDRWLQQGGAQKIAAGLSRARANGVALPVN
jgi:hypothetical protein